MVQAISKFIYTKILGWKLVGDFPKELKKYVVIGAPHTSWKDFHIALLARNSWGTKINFIGKKSIFKWPWGFFVRAFGGSPVDRTKSNNLVDAIVQLSVDVIGVQFNVPKHIPASVSIVVSLGQFEMIGAKVSVTTMLNLQVSTLFELSIIT